MTRTTVDFGIDLGTTNSAIAVLKGVDAEIVKNNDGHETTPSAVWIDRRQRLYVGTAAKERNEADPANTCLEFKLRMGVTGRPTVFEAAGRSMEAEQLSAEVLKALRRDVKQRLAEEITAAVITVPAAFELSACDATRRAAELAGLSQAPLLQEPTAAALAYGFQSTADNVFWLVYDFGGGTFDAAVVNMCDGEFTVVNHRGDNFLGGKLVDWKIVEELLIPAVLRDHPLTAFGRGEARWRKEINKLKLAAEAAKIRLSQEDSAGLVLNLNDDDGRSFDFEYDLRRGDVERITEPYIARSLDLCAKVLSESGLGPGDIEKVLLVGGPTLSPYLRERVAAGLGIALDHSQDPITVVARGAAIFAGSKRVEPVAAAPVPVGSYAVEPLEYSPIGPDTQFFVGGRVSGPDMSGLGLEFIRTTTLPWRSCRITLPAEGTFTATLVAERDVANTYLIELTNAQGSPRQVTPDRLTYTVGGIETQPTLTHAVGIGLEGNEVGWLLERGTPLPARRRTSLRTTVAIDRGAGRGMLRIPLLEGEHDRADRNRRIGRLEVEPSQVRRDVPEGSTVEFTITVDESRLVVARAYVPILDEEFEHAVNLRTETVPEHADLVREVNAEKRRLDAVRQQVTEFGDAGAATLLDRIDTRGLVPELDELAGAARTEPDAAMNCARRLLELQVAVDGLEDALEWPRVVQEAMDLLAVVRDVVAQSGTDAHRNAFDTVEAAVRAAIAAHDAHLLRQRFGDLRDLGVRVLEHSGELPLVVFADLKALRTEMSDRTSADQLIRTGERAAGSGDIGTLRAVNSELTAMLPTPPPPPDPFSTVRRS